MMFLVSLLVSFIVGLSIVSFVGKLARDAVTQFNLRQISKVLDMNFIENGKYPESINQLVSSGEVKNVDFGSYKYFISRDGQKAAILGAKSYCWRSEDWQIKEATPTSLCEP